MTYTVSVPRIQSKTERLASRVTPECRRMIGAIQDATGASESSVIEMLVRDYVKRHKIPVPAEGEAPETTDATAYNHGGKPGDKLNECG